VCTGRLVVVVILLALAITGCVPSGLKSSSTPRELKGRVVAVADGDTITILDGLMQQHKIRLKGIDAPEKSQAFGQRAKQSLSDLVFGKNVTVTQTKKDRYGRVVGKVTIGTQDVCLEQIERGYAWYYRDYARDVNPTDRDLYQHAEEAAKKERRGLWADQHPVEPWLYRRNKRETAAMN